MKKKIGLLVLSLLFLIVVAIPAAAKTHSDITSGVMHYDGTAVVYVRLGSVPGDYLSYHKPGSDIWFKIPLPFGKREKLSRGYRLYPTKGPVEVTLYRSNGSVVENFLIK